MDTTSSTYALSVSLTETYNSADGGSPKSNMNACIEHLTDTIDTDDSLNCSVDISAYPIQSLINEMGIIGRVIDSNGTSGWDEVDESTAGINFTDETDFFSANFDVP